MTGLLNAMWCWLQEFFPSLNDYLVGAYDGLLVVADALLLAFPSMTVSAIDPAYTWLLGATGISQALAIIGAALLTRFLLQSIPFVRWGS